MGTEVPIELQPLWPRTIEPSEAFETPKHRPVTIDEWLAGRMPQHLSTNLGAPLVAFQSWRNFKEAFAPELIAQAYEETSIALGRPVESCIDPFGGSGTTALACQFLGVDATTIEVNPYLADLIEAKLSSYDEDSLLADYLQVIQTAEDIEENQFPGAPDTFVAPGRKGKYIFNEGVASKLSGLKRAILRIPNARNRRLLRVLLCSIAIELSNVVVSGKGRRYRKGWQKREASGEEVLSMFQNSFANAAFDIRRYRHRSSLSYRILRGDCRTLTPKDSCFDMAIFSPPYPNSFDYTDVYNVELWVGGYLDSSESNRSLRFKTLRSHVQLKRNYETGQLNSPTLEVLTMDLENVRAQLWNKTIPDMVRAYFDDMNSVMSRLATSLVEGGRVYMVVGDSLYQGVRVPVADILTELAIDLGFTKISQEPFRSMRSSPQQGGRRELLETMVSLEKS